MSIYDKNIKYDGPWCDSEGNEIVAGDMVAYNYSGEVSRGIVKKLKYVYISKYELESPWRIHRCSIEIHNINDGNISLVKNSNGILIIK